MRRNSQSETLCSQMEMDDLRKHVIWLNCATEPPKLELLFPFSCTRRWVVFIADDSLQHRRAAVPYADCNRLVDLA